MAEDLKTAHTVTGRSDVFTVTNTSVCMYYADFTTGSGSGSAQLEMKMAGDWVPADAEVTDDMDTFKVIEATSSNTREFSWNVTVSSGTITTYLK